MPGLIASDIWLSRSEGSDWRIRSGMLEAWCADTRSAIELTALLMLRR